MVAFDGYGLGLQSLPRHVTRCKLAVRAVTERGGFFLFVGDGLGGVSCWLLLFGFLATRKLLV